MSIFKATFKPYVQRQLNARQDLIKRNVRDSRLTQYVSGKNAWTRMTSFVSLDGSADLSKQYILESGTLFPNNQGKYALKSGFDRSGSSYSNITQDGFNMGYRPMPGITSVDIVNTSAYGALREATVKYLVHTKKELEDLEILFMRPGHHVMLEWGWSMYLDTYASDSGSMAQPSNGNRLPIAGVKIKNFIEPTINAFKEELVHFDVISQMEALRHKFSGNYDGMIGLIRNFEFRLLPNGSYECTTVIISLGDVLDSLKMSSTGFPVDNGTQTDQQRLATKFETLFAPLLDLNESYFINTIIGKDLFNKSLKVPGNPQDPSNIDFNLYNVGYNNLSDNLIFKNKGVKGSLHYISIGAFIVAMSAQFNLFDPRKGGSVPLIDFEIPYPGYGNYGNGLCLASKYSVSVNPGVCMIKNSNASFVTGTPNGFDISDTVTFNSFNYPGKTNLGVIGNIYVCVEFMINKFKELARSSDGYVDVKQYITEVLKECSNALGGINEFKMFAMDASVVVFDAHYVEPDSAKNTKYQMNVLGTDSVIKNFNISSKIFTAQTHMIAVAAQSRENIGAVQSSTFNYLNRGLSDRLVLQKLDKDAIDAIAATKQKDIVDQDNEYKNQLAVIVNSLRVYLQNFLDPKKRDLSQVSPQVDAAQSNLNSVILKIATDANYKAVVPISAEVTVDGISGLTQGEIFTINPDSLPREYVGSNLGFIITKLSSHLQNSTWETIIGTQCCILDQDTIKPFSNPIDTQDIENRITAQQSLQQQQATAVQNLNNLQQVYIYNNLIRTIVEFFGAINLTNLATINSLLPQTNIFQPGLGTSVSLNSLISPMYAPGANTQLTYDKLNTLLAVNGDYKKLTDPLKSKFVGAMNNVHSALTQGDTGLVTLILVYQSGNNVNDYQKLFVKTRII